MNDAPIVLFGVAGGMAAELLKWYGRREELHRGVPDFAKSWSYWVVTFAMVAAGGLLVYAHQASGTITLSPILALNIGASAPLLLGALAKQVPTEGPSLDRD